MDYMWIVTLWISFSFVQTQSCKRQQKCKVSRIRSMKAVDCYNKDMTTISQCLPKDVEIVDLSHNRIRKITRDDLNKYPDLKILYLNDNSIAVIDKETFEGKDYLQTLDLSLNSITKLPPVLFHLPSLRSLYLGQNLNMNIVDAIEKAKPVTSPLFSLDISYVMSEEASELPDFGVLPILEKYNISGNKLMSPKTKHFAGLCNLKALDTTNVSIEYEDERCDCSTINQWLKSRNVIFKPFGCTVDETECLNEVPPDDLKLYEQCQQEVQETIRKSKLKTTLLITVPIGAVLIVTILIYFFIIRRRQKQKQRKEEIQKNDNAQEVMLNNSSKMKTIH